MSQKTRPELKIRFQTGDIPTQQDFEDLIDSAFNLLEDPLGGGVTGPTGPQGIQGLQGIQGIQGRQGTQGTFGSQLVSPYEKTLLTFRFCLLRCWKCTGAGESDFSQFTLR